MARETKDTLKMTISPALLKALGLDADGRPLDYFELFGVSRRDAPVETVEANLRERTKTLRQWQNSPEYSKEVVRLLPALHRAAKILTDPRRREAYRKELELEEKGETVGGVERFRELARVALVGSEISATDRQTLQQFAYQHGLDAAKMRQVLDEVRAEYEASRQAAPAAAEEAAGGEWEFKLAGEGEEAFQIMLTGLKASGSHIGLSTGKLVEDALSYGIDLGRAQQIVQGHQLEWYRHMVKMVAGEGVISEAQTRLLLPKAADFGLTEQQAYEIVADYSLTAMASDELMQQFKLAQETFSADDISDILDDSATRRRRKTFLEKLTSSMGVPGGTMKLAGIAAAVLVLLVIGWFIFKSMPDRDGGGTEVAVGDPNPVSTPAVASGSDPVEPGPAGETPTPTPSPTPTPTPIPMVIPDLVPDPASGMLAFQPEQPGDPPAFEIAITEVTNEQYSNYLRAVLEAPPPGWPASRMYPSGQARHPVTNITWEEANKFCLWLAGQRGWEANSVRLPTAAEFKQAARGVTIRTPGNPLAPEYWDSARLSRASGVNPAMDEKWDVIRIPNIGQMYDLLSNVAEWGSESKGTQRAILGGSYNDKNAKFDPFAPRWSPPDSRQPWVGFRYVHAAAH